VAEIEADPFCRNRSLHLRRTVFFICSVKGTNVDGFRPGFREAIKEGKYEEESSKCSPAGRSRTGRRKSYICMTRA